MLERSGKREKTQENRMFSGVMLLLENHCKMLCFHCVYIRRTYDERIVFSALDNRGKMCWKIHC